MIETLIFLSGAMFGGIVSIVIMSLIITSGQQGNGYQPLDDGSMKMPPRDE